jgi:tetratricopeptide (TPR) repeat protein
MMEEALRSEYGILLLALLTAGAGLIVTGWWRRRADLQLERGHPDASAVFVRNPDASTSHDSGELVLSLPRQREGLALNPVAARCWELIDSQRSLASIAGLIAAEYQVTHATALEEIVRFASRLRDGYYALEEREWRLSHIHYSDLFAGARDPGITELRRGDSLIVHVATESLRADNTLDRRLLRRSWSPRRRRAMSAFDRHTQREAPLREAMRAFESGWAHSAAGRLEPAEAAFLEASRLAPGWANPHYQLGYVHLRGRRYEQAVQEFERTEQSSPGYFMVREYLHLARRLAEGRLRFEAFHLFERATTAEPVDPDAVITLCRRALELSPEFPSARLVLGRAYARKRDYENALAELRSAIDTEPDNSTLCNALFARGSIFMARGMAEQAVREFEMVIELNGSPIATRSAMAHLASSASVH